MRAALRVGRKVGDNMWEWAGLCVCVCFMCLYCLSSSCVLCTQCYQSIQSPEVSTSLLRKKQILYRWPTFLEVFLIFSHNFWNIKWLWSILDFHFGFLTGTWVQDFFFLFIKISYLECMFNFRTPRACFITILGHINIFHKFSIYIQNVLSI